MKIDGKLVASEILSALKLQTSVLKERGITPHLYIVTFGQNPQTESYLKQKLLRADEIGAKITIKRFPTTVSPREVLNLISSLNEDRDIHGIIVQRPLIDSLSEEETALAVREEKDVDGFHPNSKFSVPIAMAVLKLIETTLKNGSVLDFLKTKNITVVGKGTTAGKPTIEMFKKMGLSVNIIDSKTQNKAEILNKSDIIVSAVGKKVIEKDDIKKGVILIGVGMHTNEEGRLKGDYDEEEIMDKASFYTPTPGGVGPVNVTMLMSNLVEASKMLTKIGN